MSSGTPTGDVSKEILGVGVKLPEVLECPVMNSVYTLPEEPENEENCEENTEM